MVPAQVVAEAVAMFSYAGPKPSDLCHKGIPIEMDKIFIHVGCLIH